MTATVIQGDARSLPLPDESVDLIVTSPPYWSLRSYQDGGKAYDGQIGAEPTSGEYVAALLDCTREWMRVLKATGSLWVNLGDKYGNRKSLLGLPWRYVLRCIDDLGLILRAEVIWSKPNSIPESVTDRVRRSHEQWFHLVKQPRYYAAVDEIRKERASQRTLGRLPGSVWEAVTQPLRVPEPLRVDHYAAFPPKLIRSIILGWSPPGICSECGQGRAPVVEIERKILPGDFGRYERAHGDDGRTGRRVANLVRIVGYACDCPKPTAPTRPAVVLDPFGGTGTTALVADLLGRHGISIDRSADYCRLAKWRIADPNKRASALGAPKTPQREIPDGQMTLEGIA